MGVCGITVLNWEKCKSDPRFGDIPTILQFLGYDPFPPATTLSERLLAYRRSKGLSFAATAHRLNLDPATWAGWEAGEAIRFERHRITLRDADIFEKLSAKLFRGTLTQTSVYPREIVKEALKRNAASTVFAHNHPYGMSTPSQADRQLTKALSEALALSDVRVLDHFIVAGNNVLSFAELGAL